MPDPKEIVRRVTEDPWRGKLEDAIGLIADDYVGYIPAAPGPIHGKAGFKEFISAYVAAFPDGKITVDDQIAEGEKVATRWTGSGTNTGELMGMPATGKEVTVSGVAYTRIVDGKVRESWNSWDTLSMLQQLGAVPETAASQT
jgi:steroid delta-isomerase-like uncharacterized protein